MDHSHRGVWVIIAIIAIVLIGIIAVYSFGGFVFSRIDATYANGIYAKYSGGLYL